MRKQHLLYIAFWFPPSRASGVYRALATTKAFVKAGWDVSVITTTEEFLEEEIGSTDPSLLDEIPDGIEVIRVPFSFIQDASRVNVRRMSWFHGNYPRLWRVWFRVTRPIRELFQILAGKSPAAYTIADNYVTWIEPTVSAALKRHHARPFDAILATGNPFSAFEVARLASDLTGAPYTVDYRDPWTIDVFTGDDIDFPPGTVEAEAAILEGASAAVHVNEPIARAYRNKYPAVADRQAVALNGYDAESLGTPRGGGDGPIVFGILGTVNDRWPLEPIFEAWIEARGTLPVGSKLILGGHLGYFARSESSLRMLLPDEDDGFEYRGAVPKTAIASFYTELNVVIVPVPGGPMVTSGKVFEAAALGIPIVCVQAEGGGARQILDGHPLAVFAEPDPVAVRTALNNAAKMSANLTEADSAAVRQSMSGLERSKGVEEMVRIVEEASSR